MNACNNFECTNFVVFCNADKYFIKINNHKGTIFVDNIPLQAVERTKRGIGGMNFLYFSLNHHEYIYRMVNLYNR